MQFSDYQSYDTLQFSDHHLYVKPLFDVEEEERVGCFAFVVLRMSCWCKCSVTLPHGAMGWSAVCDCGIS